MSIKARTTYTAELDGYEFPIPFPFLEDSEILRISDDGRTAHLGVLVQDEDCPDPLEEYDEGTLVQFNRSYIHYEPRPDLDDFKRLVRANPGRVVLIGHYGDAYKAEGAPLAVADTKGNQLESALDGASGYYIAPVDVTCPASYAAGMMEEYSAWLS